MRFSPRSHFTFKFIETTGSITIITVSFHAMMRIRKKRITFVVDQILIYYG